MRCARVRKYLNPYLDAELSSRLSGELAAHLQGCPSCRQASMRLRRLGDVMQSAAASPVPASFAERVLSQARQQVASPPPAARASTRFIRRWRSVRPAQRAAAAAMLVIGLSTGMFMGWQTASIRAAQATAAAPPSDDPVTVFNLDYLGSQPAGSLPRAYLSLVSAQNGPGD